VQITSTLTFAAPCQRVAAMFVNPAFAERVGVELKADSVATAAVDHGMRAQFTLDSPPAAQVLLGKRMTLVETTTWGPAGPDGARQGRLTMKVEASPVLVDGELRLAPTATGSTIVYQATFTVRVPLLGPRIEQAAQQALTGIIAACERVGNAWLAQQQPA
jgi:hypothetical protein